MDDIKYWVWLSSLPGIGARRFKQLIDHFGLPEEVWNANEKQLQSLQGFQKIIPSILDINLRNNIDTYMHRVEKLDIKILRVVDEDYPSNLKDIYDPPPVLHVCGKFEKTDDKAIAIVGSRNATEYGRGMAKEIANELALRGITVVSGMARGIDTFAHKGAIEVGGRTIAVMGCGVDVPYPPENRRLMDMVSKSGAVISEYPIGIQPFAGNFPARNRIVSGLSMGVVVIEAAERSGALITVDFALEQGKEVFALPGRVKSEESKGTNKLIKDGAKIVTCTEDILEEFANIELYNPKMHSVVEQKYSQLNFEEIKILEVIHTEPTHIDNILRGTGYNIQKINSLVTMLELKGILKQLPGKFFIRA